MKNCFPEWIEEFNEVQDKCLLWDLVKYKIRQVSIKYSKDKAKKRKDKLAEIENKVKNCQNKCAIDPSVNNFSELEEIQSQYNTIHDYITQGNIVRSKAKWYEYGEKNNKYFFNLENKAMSKTCIRKVFNKENKLIF